MEKQVKVHDAKLKIQKEYKEKQKTAETQRRIQRAVVYSEIRIRKMQAREQLVAKVKEQTMAKLAASVTRDANAYATLLAKLVVQGLIMLNETKVEVKCREADVRIVQAVMDKAARQYEKLVHDATQETIKVEVTLNDKYLAAAPGAAAQGAATCIGGVKLLAKGGRIVVDNTLDSRLSIAFEDLMPTIRKMLFSQPL